MNVKNQINSKITSTSLSLFKQQHSWPQWLKQTVSELATNPDIIITDADKNMGTVIISTADYIRHANDHLSKVETYKPLPDFPKKQIMANWKRLRKMLLEHGKLYKFDTGTHFSDVAKFILQLDPTENPNHSTIRIGNFYMLMKVHKKEVAGRPIVSCINTMTYFASKYIDKIIQPIMKQLSSYVTSSQHLLYELEVKGQSFPHDCWILCADIDSLYPNIPTKEGVQFFKQALLRYNSDSQFFPAKDIDFICSLLHWVLINNFFSFGNNYYQQLNGTAMGTPAAVVYACLVLDEVEFIAFSKLSFRPLLYKRFIDDILSLLQSQPQCIALLEAICTVLPSIQSSSFTISDQRGVFLDVELYKGPRFAQSGIWDFKLFQKPQNKYLYLTPSSHHPPHVFKAWITAEVNRYRLLNSEQSNFNSICTEFKQRLLDRGYSENFIRTQFNQHSTREDLLSKLKNRYLSLTTKIKDKQSPPLLFQTKYNTLIRKLKISKCLHPPEFLSQHQVFSSIFDRSPIICYSNYPNLRSKLCKARKTLHTSLRPDTHNRRISTNSDIPDDNH